MPPAHDLRLIGLVGAGGAVGTFVRWAVEESVPRVDGWPWGTFLVNVVGSLVLGLLLELLLRRGPENRRRRQLRLALGTGFCGGLTTYSTFAVEVQALLRNGSGSMALGYAVASVGAGMVAVLLGIVLAGRFGGRRSA